ncbi:phosphoserine aminotransferase [Xylaria sp. FL1042]|nr:phosphoserine aminotransferase [Xylaria sp. FL1042]
MPSRSDIITYFDAGPSALPTAVIENAADALVNFNGTGLGIAEHSHRSAIATKVINGAKDDLAPYLDIPDDYEVLFMHGGGSGEFDDNSVSILKSELKNLKMDYIITGSWSQKAAAEAERLFGSEHVNIVADSRKTNGKFGTIPDESTWNLSKRAALVFYCDNETLILSRKIPIKNFPAIFFGAQENLGLAGLTCVVIKKSFLLPATSQPSATLMRQLGLPIPPRIFEYETIAKNNSLYNTLSIFDVYVAGQVLKGLLLQHPDKVLGQQALSEKKAQLIYKALDAHPDFYKVILDKTVRSRMNICFRIEAGDAAEEAFLEDGTAQGLTGLRGHHSVRGIRASNYNAIPLDGAEKLANFIDHFASQRDKSVI